MLVVGLLLLATSAALLWWCARRSIAANPTTRIGWWSGHRLTQPRWNWAVVALALALFSAGGELTTRSWPLWTYFVAGLVVIAVMVAPVIDHNGRLKYGDRW